MIVQLSEADAEHQCLMLCDMCRNMLDELETSGNQILAYRVGVLYQLANTLAGATPLARERVRGVGRLIDRVIYHVKENEQ